MCELHVQRQRLFGSSLFSGTLSTDSSAVEVRHFVRQSKLLQTGSKWNHRPHNIIGVAMETKRIIVERTIKSLTYIRCLFASSSFFLASQAATSPTIINIPMTSSQKGRCGYIHILLLVAVSRGTGRVKIFSSRFE